MEPTHTIEQPHSAQPLGAATSAEQERPPFVQAADLGEACNDVRESIELLVREARGFLSRQGAQNPELLLASAAGVGFILGGGLASRTGMLLMRTAAKVALAQVLQPFWGKNGPAGHEPTRA